MNMGARNRELQDDLYHEEKENRRLRTENKELTVTIASQLAEIERLRGEVEQEWKKVAVMDEIVTASAALRVELAHAFFEHTRPSYGRVLTRFDMAFHALAALTPKEQSNDAE